ncbi:hypothetical protein NSE01_13540 [Novosphingobium sediminis]|uniref:DUF2141 domain-containing protein n=1 Tax=Novosphingobium sediminis TaxID=707214 RepID=A0A512AIK3_9SPHN|nr:DUF2141 domain-containing protein [Novosphingobium sediminis]GEN99521.1 hypothetical protein NSE01_13540 [Novosphingobium sediminis]
MMRKGLAITLAALTAPVAMAAMPLPEIHMQMPAQASAAAPSSILVQIDGLRSNRGQILACMTANPKTFPDCQKDPHARHLTVPAANGETVQFRDVPQGRYAIALFHDENGNGRMDKMMMLPREGFGFSRDAPLQFGPPRFGAASFQVGPVQLKTAIKVRYIL